MEQHHDRFRKLGGDQTGGGQQGAGSRALAGFGTVSVKSLQRLGEGRFSSEEVLLEHYYEKYLTAGGLGG